MFEELRKIIEANDSIVIFGHIFPDGDCYGSQVGLRDLLRLNYPNKKVYAVGSGLHRFFKLIGEMDEVSDEIIKNSLAILVDGNDCSRMEDQRVVIAKEFIKIDHHIENYRFTEGKFVINNNLLDSIDFSKLNTMLGSNQPLEVYGFRCGNITPKAPYDDVYAGIAYMQGYYFEVK